MEIIQIAALRIGNLIQNDFKKHNGFPEYIDRVCGILKYGEIEVISEPLNKEGPALKCLMYSYIPLTEEWMLKFGFEKIILKPVVPIWEEDIEWDIAGHKFSQDIDHKWFLSGYHWNTEHFEFVHQLQNIYFALTGEELQLKQ